MATVARMWLGIQKGLLLASNKVKHSSSGGRLACMGYCWGLAGWLAVILVWLGCGGAVEAATWVQSWGGEKEEEWKLTCLLFCVNH